MEGGPWPLLDRERGARVHHELEELVLVVTSVVLEEREIFLSPNEEEEEKLFVESVEKLVDDYDVEATRELRLTSRSAHHFQTIEARRLERMTKLQVGAS